jgi:hypothetical protein
LGPIYAPTGISGVKSEVGRGNYRRAWRDLVMSNYFDVFDLTTFPSALSRTVIAFAKMLIYPVKSNFVTVREPFVHTEFSNSPWTSEEHIRMSVEI